MSEKKYDLHDNDLIMGILGFSYDLVLARLNKNE
jgi:hypothetical protein